MWLQCNAFKLNKFCRLRGPNLLLPKANTVPLQSLIGQSISTDPQTTKNKKQALEEKLTFGDFLYGFLLSSPCLPNISLAVTSYPSLYSACTFSSIFIPFPSTEACGHHRRQVCVSHAICCAVLSCYGALVVIINHLSPSGFMLLCLQANVFEACWQSRQAGAHTHAHTHNSEHQTQYCL